MTNFRRVAAAVGPRLLGILVVTAATVLSAGCTALPLAEDRNPDPREPSPAARIQLVTPETLGGLPQSPSRPFWNASRDMLGAIRKAVGETTSAVAVAYGGRSATEDGIVVSAAAGKVNDPKALVERIVALTKVSDVRTVRPGPLGGEARCALGYLEHHADVICVWVDDYSLGVVEFVSATVRDRGDEFVEMRGQIEKTAA